MVMKAFAPRVPVCAPSRPIRHRICAQCLHPGLQPGSMRDGTTDVRLVGRRLVRINGNTASMCILGRRFEGRPIHILLPKTNFLHTRSVPMLKSCRCYRGRARVRASTHPPFSLFPHGYPPYDCPKFSRTNTLQRPPLSSFYEKAIPGLWCNSASVSYASSPRVLLP